MKNQKKLWILLGLLVVVVIIAAVVASSSRKATTPTATTGTGANTANQNATATANTGNVYTAETNQAVNLKDTTVVVPGANPVTKDNVVVTNAGQPAQNNAIALTPAAPHQSAPITDPKTLASSVIKLQVSSTGFTPKQINVAAAAVITISLTPTDGYTHGLEFDSPDLSAIRLVVSPGETRAITFNAPKAGSYAFHCMVPGHEARGETGTMIVK
jgi:plastocyanin